ncbi:MAG: hypothetical protein AB7U81_10145 [Thiohalomonadaceae bacterium]
MDRKPKRQELVALEYLVSSACNFLVELHEDTPGEFHFAPADGSIAKGVGEFETGQRFWSMYSPKHFADPFQAAIMFVNAFRVWESKMKEVEGPRPNTDRTLH